MATFDISKDLVVTLTYYYEKNVLELCWNISFFKVPLEFSLDIRI